MGCVWGIDYYFKLKLFTGGFENPLVVGPGRNEGPTLGRCEKASPFMHSTSTWQRGPGNLVDPIDETELFHPNLVVPQSNRSWVSSHSE